MARYQQAADVWMWIGGGFEVVAQVGAYPIGRGLFAWHAGRKSWRVIDGRTGQVLTDCEGETRKAIEAMTRAIPQTWLDGFRESHEQLADRKDEIANAIEAQAERGVMAGRRLHEQQARTEQPEQPEPRQEREAGPARETRDARFRREFGDLYDWLEQAEQPNGNDAHPGGFALMERVLVLDGERFMAEHPKMTRKLARWRGDLFTSDREVAALAMWIEREAARRREQEQAGMAA